nr:F-box protein At3g07870-like [Ipomoea batatas]
MDGAKQKMSDYLPEELWVQVLVRFPVKSLLRCTAVCRSWKALIESPNFISAQLRFKRQDESQSQNSCFLVRDCIPSRKEKYEFYHDDWHSLVKFGEIEPPFSVLDRHLEFVGTCNGLLCLSDEDRRGDCCVILWNPSVRKSVCLPDANLRSSRGNVKHWLGFGFDPVSNDYKVVRVVSVVNGGCCGEIFRLSTHMWENISDSTIAKYDFLKPEQAYLDRKVYWLGKIDTKGRKMVSFDLSKERFGEMELPENLAWRGKFAGKVSVGIYMGSLAVIVVGPWECCIWIMKESWMKQVSFECHMNLGWQFGFRENGDIQFMQAFGRWDSFNPTTLKSKFLQGHEFNDSVTAISVSVQELLLLFTVFFLSRAFSGIASLNLIFIGLRVLNRDEMIPPQELAVIDEIIAPLELALTDKSIQERYAGGLDCLWDRRGAREGLDCCCVVEDSGGGVGGGQGVDETSDGGSDIAIGCSLSSLRVIGLLLQRAETLNAITRAAHCRRRRRKNVLELPPPPSSTGDRGRRRHCRCLRLRREMVEDGPPCRGHGLAAGLLCPSRKQGARARDAVAEHQASSTP